MNREDIVRMAVETQLMTTGNRGGMYEDAICEFADLASAAEREKVAQWMISRGYATGHGDTIEDLLKELEWQVAEKKGKDMSKKALDELGVAIANAGYEWTPEMRKSYEQGIRESEWVGLTDEEMKDALVSVDAETKRLPPGFRNFARAVEAKLKEKNT